jgi:hypothetical protein
LHSSAALIPLPSYVPAQNNTFDTGNIRTSSVESRKSLMQGYTREFESCMKELWGWGISLSRGSMEWTSGTAPLPGKPKDEVFERYAKCPVGGPPSL